MEGFAVRCRTGVIVARCGSRTWSPVVVFSGSEHEGDAKEFDTRGVTVYARKPFVVE